jgi:surfactin synthase thioesterase subunit/acyl carrier protein
MTADDLQTWFQPVSCGSGPSPVRLFCFPHAGGAASTFRPWRSTAPSGLEIYAAQLPGRESRILEPPVGRLDELVDRLTTAMKPAVDGEYALFGHSVGALIALAVARSLRRTAGVTPVHLFVSACQPPSTVSSSYEDLYGLDESDLLARLRDMNGTPAEAMDNPELMRLVLPAIRSDLGLLAGYEAAPDDVLDCPVTVLGGDHDSVVPPELLGLWAETTTGEVEVRVLEGDHFYLTDPRNDVLGIIGARLAPEPSSRTSHLRGTTMTELTVSERVKRVMTSVLDVGTDPEGLSDGALLYSTAIQLDSLRLLHLLTALEKEFDFQIDDEAVMSAELIDVGSVISLVSTQLEVAR